MSKQVDIRVTCPVCSHQFKDTYYRTLWIEYPENRELIFSDRLNVLVCPKCTHKLIADLSVMAVNKEKSFAVWFEPTPDPTIDEDLPQYAALFGPSNFYVTAPRIRSWDDFKETVLQFEAGHRPGEILSPSEVVIFADLAPPVAGGSFGDSLIDELVESKGFEAEWTVRSPGRVEWWPHDFRQVMWVEGPVDDDGFEIWRLQIRTDALLNFEDTEEQNRLITKLSKFALLGGLVQNSEDRSRLQIASSLFFHSETFDVTADLASACLAAHRVYRDDIGGRIEDEESFGMTLDCSAGPQKQLREELSQAGELDEAAIIMSGMRSIDLSGMFHELGGMFDRPPALSSQASSTDLIVTYPFPGGESKAMMAASERHPQIGLGVLMHISLPKCDLLPETILEMNEIEVTRFTRCNFTGSWFENARWSRRFVSFAPNSACASIGLASTLCQHLVLKGLWLTQDYIGYDLMAGYQGSSEAIRRRLREKFENGEMLERQRKPGLLKRLFGRR